jgi:hypothetical protein
MCAMHSENNFLGTKTMQTAPYSPKALRPSKFLVRLQCVQLYSMEVEARDADEADRLAQQAVKARAAKLLRSDIGHRTVERLA